MKLNYRLKYLLASAALLTASSALAQSLVKDKLEVKVTADIGVGNAISGSSLLPGMTTKSAASGFDITLGWTFWEQRQHSLLANVGLGYGSASLTADISGLDYNYQAPAAADMDNVPYIRYYELDALHQKVAVGRITVPLYLNYRYKINQTVNLNALLGFKFGFNSSKKVSDTGGRAYSYGIYPQYDNLMIDASYMNEFGNTTLGSGLALEPEVSGATVSLLVGIGADVRLWGPLAAGITLGYEAGMGNIFKPVASDIASFDAQNAPVTYTVADGQTVKPLSGFLSGSKLSRLSCGISLIYRF